jgi:hypothetical protein
MIDLTTLRAVWLRLANAAEYRFAPVIDLDGGL